MLITVGPHGTVMPPCQAAEMFSSLDGRRAEPLTVGGDGVEKVAAAVHRAATGK